MTSPPDDPRTREFRALTHEQAAAAVRRMASNGYSDSAIAAATGWSVSLVRAVLGRGGQQ